MIKAKKSLGQNFLVDENILKKIVDISEIQDRSVLEIGPGTGNLTSHILKSVNKQTNCARITTTCAANTLRMDEHSSNACMYQCLPTQYLTQSSCVTTT